MAEDDITIADDGSDDERQSLETSVAELLASLSEVSDSPSEFDPPARPFRPDEITFDSNDWMAALAAIQGWLRLPITLELTDPVAYLTQLAAALELGHIGGGESSDPPVLTDQMLDRLRERLDRAAKLQQLFIEELQAPGGTIVGATERWKEAWDDEPDEEVSSGPVSAKAHTWAINEFSDRADRKRLNLSPSYQRSDVWPTTDSQLLIESILRGIPLPSVILLRPEDQHTVKALEVVDGKQRLTAILRFIGRHPLALETVRSAQKRYGNNELTHLFTTNYPKFRRLWRNLTGEQLTSVREREYYFPFRLRSSSPALTGDLAGLAGKYYTQIRDVTVNIADELVEIGDVFERVTEYKIPVIEYTRASRRQIHEVFNLYNRQGKHLNAEEIRNALYHEQDLMRGLLVASGDNSDVEQVAPFLVPVWSDVSRIQQTLDDYSFGDARYRRTKALSWLASLLFVDSMEGGTPKKYSTSRQIDFLLDRVSNDPKDPLRQPAILCDAFLLLLHSLEAHAATADAWSPAFMGSSSSKWQEVPLVASTLGVALATAALGVDEVNTRLENARGELARQSSGERWRRPRKTQTSTQWSYIADVALLIVEQLGTTADAASSELRSRFGYSCVETLQAVRSDDRG